MEEYKKAFTDVLSVDRNGRRLGAGFIEVVATYLVEVLKMQDVKELDIAADLVDYAEAAYAAQDDPTTLPKPMLRSVKLWCSSTPVNLDTSGQGKDAAGMIGGDSDVDVMMILGTENPNTKLLEDFADDKKVQGLTGEQLLVLSMGLELGRVVTSGDVLGTLYYKSDPRLSTLAKQQRKANMKTLSSLLAEPNVRRELGTFLGSLIRDFSEDRHMIEAQLVSRWWSETQSITLDDKVLCEYIREYFRKYAGRGLPVLIDVVISTRVSGQARAASALSSDEKKKVEDSEKRARKAETSVEAVERKVASLERRLAALEGSGPAGGGGPDPRGPKCHKCGEFGHIARNCPNGKKKVPAEGDDAEKSNAEE